MIKSYEEKLKEWIKLEREARKMRKEEADWDFIEKQSLRIKAALKY